MQEEKIFYPSVSELISFDKIPIGDIGFFEDGIDLLLAKLFYRNLQVNVSADSANQYYTLDILTFQRVGYDVPGTNGLALVLNPDLENQDISSFPISVGVNIGILKYLRGFSFESFKNDPESFFKMLIEILGLDENQIITETIEVFLGDFQDPVQQFIDTFESLNDELLIVQNTSDIPSSIESILQQLEELDFDAFEVVFNDFISEVEEFSFEILYENIKALFVRILGDIDFGEVLERLLLPDVLFAINDINLALEFPRSVLQPIGLVNTGTNEEPVFTEQKLPEPNKSRLTFNVGSLKYTTKKGLEFNSVGELSFTKSEIANTGFTLFFQGAKIDLSRTNNIPEAIIDGRPDDFVGVFIEDAAIGFPTFWKKNDDATAELFGQNLLIGTGGLSGTIGLRNTSPTDPNPPLIGTTFGDSGFAIELNAFSLTFQQNSIIGSTIKGTLILPDNSFCGKDENGNDTDQPAEIAVDISIVNGDFVVTATPDENGITVCIPNVLDYKITKVAVGKQGDRYFLRTSGVFTFKIESLESILPKQLEIIDLAIWSDGQIELPRGGFLELRKPIRMQFGPAEFSITGVHLGSEERFKGGEIRKYRYFGFDGGIGVDPGGVDVRGSGLKFYYSVDDGPFDFFIRLESLSIDIIVPGSSTPEQAAAIIKGFLSIKDDDGVREYIGGVSIQLPKIKVGGSASMRYRPSVPSFAVDVAIDLSTPIPLGPTSTGIYGLRGLIGSNYIVDKSDPSIGLPAGATWYDFYKKKIAPVYREGIGIEKLVPKSGFTVGAGVSLATAFDGGNVLSTKLMVIISPSLFYLEGQLALLKERVKLSDTRDLPFFAILAISDESVYTAFGVNYLLPEDSGSILSITGKAEMEFFFKNANAWYVNIGTEEKPITAKALSIFNATSFLELSVRGIEFGATANFKIQFGSSCFGIRGEVYVGMGGMVSFKPIKFGGYVIMGGGIGAKIFCVGLDIDLFMKLAVIGPRQLVLCGRIQADLCVKVWKFKKCKTLRFKFEKAFGRPEPTLPIQFLEPESGQAVNMMTGESFGLLGIDRGSQEALPALRNLDNYSIPMDSFIEFEFTKGVTRGNGSNVNKLAWNIGTRGYQEKFPPQKGKGDQVTHEYSVEDVKIYAHASGQLGSTNWVPYPVFNALVPVEADDLINPAVVNNLKYGSFQIDGANRQNKLVLLSANPFNYLQQGTQGPLLEYLGLNLEDLFCGGTKIEEFCDRPGDTDLSQVTPEQKIIFQESGAEIRVPQVSDIVSVFSTYSDIPFGLRLEEEEQATIEFPVPSGMVSLKLATFNAVKVTFIAKVAKENETGPLGEPILEDRIVKTEEYTSGQLAIPLVYENEREPIKRIVLEHLSNDVIDDTLSCDLPGIEATTNLLTLLNGVAGDGTLNSGSGITYQENITNHLPTGISSCTLNLEYPVALNRTYQINITNFAFWFRVKSVNFEVDGRTYRYARRTINPAVFLQGFAQYLNQNFSGRLTAEVVSFNQMIIRMNEDIGIRFRGSNGVRLKLNDITVSLFSFAAIESFDNLRPSNNLVEGGNYGFLVDAQLSNGEEVVLGGRTDCISYVCCTGATYNAYVRVCTGVINQINELTTEIQELTRQIEEAQLICDTYSNADDECKRIGIRYCDLVTEYTQQRDVIIIQRSELQTWYDANCATLKNQFCNGTLPSAGGSYLLEVCWLKDVDFSYNNNLPTRIDSANEMEAYIQTISQSIQPIWRADTDYLVQVKIRDDQKNAGQINDFHLNYMFRTQGPIGHFHQLVSDTVNDQEEPPTIERNISYRQDYLRLLNNGNQDQYKLDSLKEYIDYGKSYPNADGSIVNAKPLYYVDPKLYLFFRRNYIKTMFNGFREIPGLFEELSPEDNTFFAVIADPSSADVIVLDNDRQGFQPNRRPFLTPDLQYMQQILELSPCYNVTVDPPKGVHFEIDLVNILEPSRLYTAVYKSTFLQRSAEVVIHQYNFQTSRYANFDEHIQSYNILNEDTGEYNKAYFDIKLTNEGKPAAEQYDLSKVDQIIDDELPETDPLITTFMDQYDRLMNGGLKVKSLEDPLTTEVNFIRDYDAGSSDRFLGILIRTPEPFNDPKIPTDTLLEAIRVLDENDEIKTDYTAIFLSKDRAKVFISNEEHEIKDRYLKVEFDYLRYDPDEGFIVVEDGTSAIVIDDVPVYKTKLIDADCGRVEVELNETLTAFATEDILLGPATQYTFNISNSEIDETVVSETPTLDLSSLPLDYNRQYEVKVKSSLPDREVSFGDVCNIDTRKLAFVLSTTTNNIIYKEEAIEVEVRLQFIDGTVFTGFNETLQLDDLQGTVADQLLQFVNGVATLTIPTGTPGIVELSVNDIVGTGYDLPSSTVTIEVIEHATKLVVGAFDTNMTTGINNPVTLQALSGNDVLDKLYAIPIQYSLTGGAIQPQAFTLGEATVNIFSSISREAQLTFFTTDGDVSLLNEAYDLLFLPADVSNYTYQLTASETNPVPLDTDVIVTVTVLNASQVQDSDYQIPVNVRITNAGSTIDEVRLMDIVNGSAQTIVTSSVDDTLTITIEEIVVTGIPASTPLTITFLNEE